MATLPVRKGISSSTVIDVPDTWSADWFRRFIKTQLSQADIRNATPGLGISITGDATTVATVAISQDVQVLFHQPYLMAAAPTSTTLDNFRTIAAQASVLTVTDGGPEASLVVGVATNGIGNTQLRKGSALSVIGNAGAAPANVADITSSVDGFLLRQVAGALAFGTIKLADTSGLGSSLTTSGLTSGQVLQATGATTAAFTSLAIGSLAPIAALSLVGNNLGGAGAPVALTETQVTAMLNLFGATLQGVVPASGGGTANFLRADGSWQAPPGTVAGANPSASVGLGAVNGTATTYMRSDGAPALSQSIAPTWTGLHTWSQNLGIFSATGNPFLKLVNTSATAQTPVDFFSNTGTLTGRIRNDFAGDMAYVTFLSGVHSFFVAGDSGVGVDSLDIKSGKINLAGHTTTTTAPAAGGAGALPATPKGYVTMQVKGTDQQFAFY